jgi:hypothetical protein
MRRGVFSGSAGVFAASGKKRVGIKDIMKNTALINTIIIKTCFRKKDG